MTNQNETWADKERIRVPAGDYAVVFTVEGSGEFPWDMLRYDGCFPADESPDVRAIAATYTNIDNTPRKRRVVLVARPLAGERYVNLTPGRWASFSWRFVGLGAQRELPSKEPRAIAGTYL